MGAQHWRHRTHTLRCDGRHQHQNEQMSGGRQRRGGVTTTRCALAVRTHARHPCAPRQTGLCGQAGPPAVWVWPLGLRGQCDAGRWCQMGPHRRHGGTGQVGNTAKPPPAVRPLPSPSPQMMPAKRPSLEVRVGGGAGPQEERGRRREGGEGERGRRQNFMGAGAGGAWPMQGGGALDSPARSAVEPQGRGHEPGNFLPQWKGV